MTGSIGSASAPAHTPRQRRCLHKAYKKVTCDGLIAEIEVVQLCALAKEWRESEGRAQMGPSICKFEEERVCAANDEAGRRKAAFPQYRLGLCSSSSITTTISMGTTGDDRQKQHEGRQISHTSSVTSAS